MRLILPFDLPSPGPSIISSSLCLTLWIADSDEPQTVARLTGIQTIDGDVKKKQQQQQKYP